MIWEAPPGQENIDLLDNLGIGSVVYNPVANFSGSSNYMNVMNVNAENLKKMFR